MLGRVNVFFIQDEFKDLFVDRPVLVQAFGLDSLEEKYNSVIEKVKDVKKTLAKLKDPETLVVVGEAEHVDEKKDIGRRRRGSVVSVIVDEPVSDEAAAAAEFYDNFTFENVMEMYKAWSQQQRFLEDNPKAFEMYINETCCSGMGQSSPNRGYFSQEEERDGDNSTSETLQEVCYDFLKVCQRMDFICPLYAVYEVHAHFPHTSSECPELVATDRFGSFCIHRNTECCIQSGCAVNVHPLRSLASLRGIKNCISTNVGFVVSCWHLRHDKAFI